MNEISLARPIGDVHPPPARAGKVTSALREHVIEAMGAGRRAARSMKDYLHIRDCNLPCAGSEDSGAMFLGLDLREQNFARVYAA